MLCALAIFDCLLWTCQREFSYPLMHENSTGHILQSESIRCEGKGSCIAVLIVIVLLSRDSVLIHQPPAVLGHAGEKLSLWPVLGNFISKIFKCWEVVNFLTGCLIFISRTNMSSLCLRVMKVRYDWLHRDRKEHRVRCVRNENSWCCIKKHTAREKVIR